MIIVLIAMVLTGTQTPASAATARSSVWVGSPINGNWARWDGYCPASYPSDYCEWPTVHHTYKWGMPFTGDWGTDLHPNPLSQDVILYAAPNDTWRSISAKVENVALACSARQGESWQQTYNRGGQSVVVGLYEGGTRLGWVTYTHVNPVVSAGQWIGRWGSKIGTVGTYISDRSNTCWTGVHLHFEMTNETNYSCYNKGWQSNQAMSRTNFVGFIGGAYRTAPRQACP